MNTGSRQIKEADENSFYQKVKSGIEYLFRAGDRVANNLFGSDYNPLYKTGTIAVLLMSVVTITGLVLAFFYRLSEPYESIKWMTEKHYFVGWLRSMHRFASGAAVMAVVLHAFRMFAQGKSWGPRTFSWITGILLLLFLFVSGWTGYVMVWDQHALALVTAGARMLDATGLLADPISRSFNGAVDQPPGSFFFLNLFLHVVVPLAMIFGTWIHTSRMARATWFPPKKILWGVTIIYLILGFMFSASLGPKADMLSLPAEFQADWFYSFFVPWSVRNPGFVFLGWVVVFGFLCSLPFWLYPRKKTMVPAHNDEKRCIGCVQCVVDCPYEAIKMVPRTDGAAISKEVASVIEDLCVSCGLCAGSCSPMTIGVPNKKGSDHYQTAKNFVAETKKKFGDSQKLNIIIGCQNQPGALEKLQSESSSRSLPAVVFPTECMGTLHMGVVEYLAQHFEHLYLAACPERNCSNKDAHLLLRERLEGKREPLLLGRVSKDRIILVPTGDGEEERVLAAIKTGSQVKASNVMKNFAPALLGFIFLLGLAKVSMTAMSLDVGHSVLRLSWRLTGQIIEECRERTAEEMSKMPAHMRTAKVCNRTMSEYSLKVLKNGKVIIEETVTAGGLHQDRPIYVDRDVEMSEGEAEIQIEFQPKSGEKFKSFSFGQKINFREGKIALIHLNNEQTQLTLKEGL